MGNGGLISGAFSSGGHVPTPVSIANGGTGQTAQQAAIDALTDVSAASTNEVLTKDGAGNAVFASAAGGGGAFEKIGSTTLTGTAATIDVTFTAVDQVDIAKIVAILNYDKDTSNATVDLQVNSLATATYNWGMIQQSTGAAGGTSGSGNNQWTALTNNAGDEGFITSDITCNSVTDLLQTYTMTISENHQMIMRGQNTTASQTSISKVDFRLNAGNFNIGTRLDVFRLNIA